MIHAFCVFIEFLKLILMFKILFQKCDIIVWFLTRKKKSLLGNKQVDTVIVLMTETLLNKT